MFVSMVAGVVSVVIFGIIMMLVLYAGNLDTLLMVSPAVTDICCIYSFFVIYFKVCWSRLQCMFHPLLLLIILLILTALVMRLVYLSVPLMVWLVIILVLTQGMLMLTVKV